MSIFVGFSLRKKNIYSQNGHKLNHMFQKLLFHMFKSYFSASSTMFSDSNYRIWNQSVSSIAIEVLRPMPSEQPPFNTAGVRQFFLRSYLHWGYHSSTFTNTLGREKILMALSISESFLSSSALVVFTRSVSTLTGSAFNWARSSVWSEREINLK